MRAEKDYKIEIFGLKNGSHEFEFNFNDDFFEVFENTQLHKGKGSCKVKMEKTDAMISLQFDVSGSIELECDRSLELFEYPLHVQKNLIYKYGEEEKELSEDVFVIPKGAQQINIASFLFEIIHLEIPMKKLHPKFQNQEEEDEMVFSSKQEEREDKVVDPRWEALKKLK